MRFDLCGDPEEIRYEPDLHLNGASAYSRNLPLPNYVYRFVSPDCSPRCLEIEEPECGVNSPFDEPMVLLDDIIEVLRLSQLSEVGEGSFFLQLLDRRGIGWIFIDVDHSRRWVRCGLEHLAEEPFGGSRVSFRAQHEIDCLSRRVNCAVEILPGAFDFDVGLIDAVRVVGQSQVRTNSFL
jgi:hypothetical protein